MFQFLERKKKAMFRLNIVILSGSIIFGTWMIYSLMTLFKATSQSQEYSFYVWPAIKEMVLGVIFIYLSWRRIWFVFPLIFFSYLFFSNFTLHIFKQIFQEQMFFPVLNISSFFSSVLLVLSIIGTILWYRNMRYHGGKFWQ